jgi:ankyrin repeat protein
MDDPVAAFLEASVWHGSLDESAAILAAHPEVAGTSIHTAAVLGDDAAVRRFLELDSGNATAKGGPHGWDALTYLCFSKYLRLDPARSPGFLLAARALLDAGASANTGFLEGEEFETALYGAAGVAHHTALTRLLVDRGADPNDGEVTYHTPESYDNGALHVLVATGKLTPQSLATMLLRKHDWHDYDGARWLLEHRADPNLFTHWKLTPLHQAIRRDNAIGMIEALLDHGGNPLLEFEGRSGVAMAARRGRGDLLDLFERRGIPVELQGVDGVIAACARDREAAGPLDVADGGKLLAEFAGNGNTNGVRRLLDLGIAVTALFEEGDGYWDVARNSTALHVAAWRARHTTVKLLVERGAPVAALDAKGRTALMLAVRACVDSYWTSMRSPESVETLRKAGASVEGVRYPSGYAQVDELLARSGAKE